jgi:hypothetical protein
MTQLTGLNYLLHPFSHGGILGITALFWLGAYWGLGGGNREDKALIGGHSSQADTYLSNKSD